MRSDKYEYKLPDDTDGFIVECRNLEFSEDIIKDLDEMSNGMNTDKRIILKLFTQYDNVDFKIGETVKVIYKNTVFKGTVEELRITITDSYEKVLVLTYVEQIDN